MKEKNYLIITINTEKKKKTRDKIQHSVIKILNRLRLEGNYVNIIKITYEKQKANIILSGENMKAFPLRY